MSPMEKGGVMLSVRVTPRSAHDEVAGWDGDVLRVRLRAPPVEGRANEALRRLLAAELGIPAGRVRVVSGASARTKRIWIEGANAEDIATRLGGAR